MTSFTHILNTVSEKENPSVNKIQKITFEGIKFALASTAKTVDVNFIEFSAFEHGKAELPCSRFVYTDHALNRKPGFEQYKALPYLIPFLKEIGPSLSCDNVIFTNIDIIPTEHFYTVVDKLMKSGHDAIIINRRRVSQKYLDHFDYTNLITEAGKSHGGYDTFVFKASLIDKFAAENVCLGVPPAGNDLFYNLFTVAQNPVLYTEKALTFHIGMELYKEWGDKKTKKENYRSFKKMLTTLKPNMDISKFPGSELGFIRRHFKWFWNPTFSYPIMFSVDIKQFGKKRKARKKAEVKGFKHKFLEWVLRKANFED
ncbi:MAG TPA: hypothetical protein VK177_09305 [Flavobacteriales bacterium]|nr:hypothetical protein [Flavobacteriales bacterium]